MSELLSDEHVAAVNATVERILGEGKHILARQPECITIGDVLFGFYKRYKEFEGHYATDPWKVNYSKSGKMIVDDKIYDVIVPAMQMAASLKFMEEQLLCKVIDEKRFHHMEWADREYFRTQGSPSWTMTDAGKEFYETLALPVKSKYSAAPRRNKPPADSGAMAPTAVA